MYRNWEVIYSGLFVVENTEPPTPNEEACQHRPRRAAERFPALPVITY